MSIARQRVRAVEDRPGAAQDFHRLDRIEIDEAHFDARTIGGCARVVEPLAVHEHEHARRIETASRGRT
jgi:hypothetical protein